MKICFIIALHAEAAPLIEFYDLKKVDDFFSPLPCELYQNPSVPELSVVLTGSDHERDLIGCEAACVTTMAAIQRLKPELVISSGTCGGFKCFGGVVGRVYIGSGAIFHDRRVPGDNAWGTQSIGDYHLWEGSKKLYEQLKECEKSEKKSFDLRCTILATSCLRPLSSVIRDKAPSFRRICTS